MKPSPAATFLPLIVLATVLGGCAVEPLTPFRTAAASPLPAVAPAAPVVAPAAPAVAPTAPVVTPAAPEPPAVPAPPLPPPPPLAPEIASVIEHLTQTADGETLSHDLSDTTGFPEAIASLAPGAQAPKVEIVDTRFQPPARGLTADGDSTELVERDWTGLVLVPINTALSKAYTTAVRLLKVEAHPLRDGRIRVWIRLKNIAGKQLPAEIACAFRMDDDGILASPYFYEIEVPAHDYRDVFFVSPAGRLNTYTVLVRPNRLDRSYKER